MSENICRRGERMSSGVKGSLPINSSGGMPVSSGGSPKIASNSLRNIESTGVGMLSVGEKTMPTLRILILLISELLIMLMRKEERARMSAKFAFGSLFTRTL